MKEQTRERMPQQWAALQYDLGLVLSMLGEREDGTERLEEAVEAYREALQESARELAPVEWATTVGSQGMALALLGERLGDLKRPRSVTVRSILRCR